MEVPLRAAADWPAPVERASAPEERIVPEVGTKEVISGRNPVREVLRAGRRKGHILPGTLLLVGVMVNAVCGAAVPVHGPGATIISFSGPRGSIALGKSFQRILVINPSPPSQSLGSISYSFQNLSMGTTWAFCCVRSIMAAFPAYPLGTAMIPSYQRDFYRGCWPKLYYFSGQAVYLGYVSLSLGQKLQRFGRTELDTLRVSVAELTLENLLFL